MSDVAMLSAVDIVPALHCSISSLFESGRYSDMIVRCSDGTDYHVHKSVVYTQCKLFANAADGSFQESSGLVTLANDPPAAIRALLQHLYGIEYTEDPDTALVVHHARVYTIGEIYQVPELKTLAAARFREAASFVRVNYEDLAQAIKEIYESTPTGDRTLRDAARDVVMEKLDELISDDAFMHTLEEVGAFAMLLSRALWEKMNKMKEKMQEMVAKGKITPHFECPGCFSHEVIHGHEAFKPKKIVECPSCGSAYTWKTWKERVVREE
ncbi:hypothetical protein GTA08_BOTSDO12390 [Botryosphaeria dothidea]|uniref:BTB domain-containing protein n=1 Tax=Botryosphaeria dothidea TaxID=55169 RepID=A0A8H4NEK0_9PEZI|nr:hypothetical protein GTA08_BOTSDO12390 [Botryosphaeria dothidea]